MQWDEIIEEFCLDITVKGFSAITIKNYRCKLNNTSKFFIEKEIFPLDLKKNHINEWIIYQQKMKYQASTINVSVSRLKKLYDYMIDEEYITHSPFERIKRLPEQQKYIVTLNEKEIHAILSEVKRGRFKHINQRNLLILMLMLDCGLRLSEVTNLKNGNVLQNQLLIKNSKNNKDRVVALSPILLKEMMKYQRIKNKRYGKEYATDDDSPYFVSYKRGKMCNQAINEMLNDLAKRVKIRKEVRFSPHTLRHTYATMQIKNGMDIFTLSLNLGHSDLHSTQTYIKTLQSGDFINKSIKHSNLMNML